MKKILKKVKSLFLILLIVPMLFVFSACKKNNDSDNSQNKPPIEQPSGGNGSGEDSSGGGDDDLGDEQNPPVVLEKTFNLDVNYALPKYLEGLINDENLSPKIDEGYVLPTFDDTEFEDYFAGWYTTEIYDEESKIEDLILTAEENEKSASLPV